MDEAVRRLFDRYEMIFNRSLQGEMSIDEATSVYADAFIAASPAGVMVGSNDDQLKKAMTDGYAHYRAIGTKEMRIRDVRVSPIDDSHCVAHIAWTAFYEKDGRPRISIDFDVHYFVLTVDEQLKIFGWVSGDEQALLKEHGIT